MLNKIRYIEKIMFDQMSHLFNNIFLSISQGPKGSIKKFNGEKNVFLNIAYRSKITAFNRPIFSVCLWREFFLTVSQNNIL